MRQISKEDARLFLRSPEKLLELELAEHEVRKSRSFEGAADPTKQFYDWHVLLALVSGSTAWALLVKSGQKVGESEQMWAVFDADARILDVEQVQELNSALHKLLAEEDEQSLIDLAMAEQPNSLLHIQQAGMARTEEWTVGDSVPEECWSELQKGLERPKMKINLELFWMKQQVQQFIQAVVEAKNALLIIA